MNFLEETEHELVLGVQSEDVGSHEQISNIGSPLPGVSVEGEQGVELGDVLGREDGVFG